MKRRRNLKISFLQKVKKFVLSIKIRKSKRVIKVKNTFTEVVANSYVPKPSSYDKDAFKKSLNNLLDFCSLLPVFAVVLIRNFSF